MGVLLVSLAFASVVGLAASAKLASPKNRPEWMEPSWPRGFKAAGGSFVFFVVFFLSPPELKSAVGLAGAGIAAAWLLVATRRNGGWLTRDQDRVVFWWQWGLVAFAGFCLAAVVVGLVS